MILVDPRVGSADLLPIIRKIGVQCQLEPLDYGDACFQGWGPHGQILIGVERKKIDDLLQCIKDGRFSGHQRPGLVQAYKVRYLIVEGYFCPSDNGILLESIDGSWFFQKRRVGAPATMYHTLYRYLLSVGFAGVTVTHSRNAYQTAFNICEMYHYFQKKWDQHQSMMQMHTIAIPNVDIKIPLVQKWAAAVHGVGTKLCIRAAQYFKTPIELANSDPTDWTCIPGISDTKAEEIVNEICGIK